MFVTGDPLPASTANAWPRSYMQKESNVDYVIPLTCFRYADGSIPDTTGAVGNPKIVNDGAGSVHLEGENAQAVAKTEILCFDFILPECYISADEVSVLFGARYKDSGANVMAQKTIDCTAYTFDNQLGISADLCATAVQTLTGTMAEYEFDITPTGFLPGVGVRIYVTTALEGSDAAAVVLEFGGAKIRTNIKG